MDLITDRTINITHLGMNGLMERQHAVASNIANVMTPGFQRKEVAFESQLSEIIENDNLKNHIKGQNSIKYTPQTVEDFMAVGSINPTPPKSLTTQEAKFLQSNLYKNYTPQVMDDVFTEGGQDGNNVELEREMMDLTKAGTKYVILSNLEKRAFTGLNEILKSQ